MNRSPFPLTHNQHRAANERERPTASARNGPRSLVRGCPENADADSATLALPSTEPRMKRAAIGHSLPLALAALFVRGSVLGNARAIFIIGGERSAGHGEICANGGARARE